MPEELVPINLEGHNTVVHTSVLNGEDVVDAGIVITDRLVDATTDAILDIDGYEEESRAHAVSAWVGRLGAHETFAAGHMITGWTTHLGILLPTPTVIDEKRFLPFVDKHHTDMLHYDVITEDDALFSVEQRFTRTVLDFLHQHQAITL